MDMDRGAWQVTVHGVKKLDTTTHARTYEIVALEFCT